VSAVSGQVEFKVHGSKLSQGCVLSLDLFATSMNWMRERMVGQGMNGVSFGQDSYTHLDFADDVSLLLPSAGWKMSTCQRQQHYVAGKVTVGLALHWPHVTHIHLQVQWPKEGRSAQHLRSSKEYGTLYLYLSFTIHCVKKCHYFVLVRTHMNQF